MLRFLFTSFIVSSQILIACGSSSSSSSRADIENNQDEEEFHPDFEKGLQTYDGTNPLAQGQKIEEPITLYRRSHPDNSNTYRTGVYTFLPDSKAIYSFVRELFKNEHYDKKLLSGPFYSDSGEYYRFDCIDRYQGSYDCSGGDDPDPVFHNIYTDDNYSKNSEYVALIYSEQRDRPESDSYPSYLGSHPTKESNLPGGIVLYEGESSARRRITDWDDIPDLFGNGKAVTKVDFDAGTVEAVLNEFDGGLAGYEAQLKGATIDRTFFKGGEVVVSDSQGRVVDTNFVDASGQFFGPNAEELGGGFYSNDYQYDYRGEFYWNGVR